jgi:hypothetical protein
MSGAEHKSVDQSNQLSASGCRCDSATKSRNVVEKTKVSKRFESRMGSGFDNGAVKKLETATRRLNKKLMSPSLLDELLMQFHNQCGEEFSETAKGSDC